MYKKGFYDCLFTLMYKLYSYMQKEEEQKVWITDGNWHLCTKKYRVLEQISKINCG